MHESSDPVPELRPAGISNQQQAEGVSSCLRFWDEPGAVSEGKGSREQRHPLCSLSSNVSGKRQIPKTGHLKSTVGELLQHLPKDDFSSWELERAEGIYARYTAPIQLFARPLSDDFQINVGVVF